MATHTEPSRLFTATRIEGHPMQVLASARVLVWFYTHHRPETVRRHQERLLRALSQGTAR